MAEKAKFNPKYIIVVAAFAPSFAALLVPFVRRQRRLEQPLIDLRPLSVVPFAIGVVANMVSLITIFSMNILVPTFMQSVLGLPSLTASLATVDASAGMGEVPRVLADHHLKKAPVMEDGRMVGIVNRSNVTKYSVNRYFAMAEAGQV